MDSLKRQILDSLPRLDWPQAQLPKCKICAANVRLFDAVDFKKHCAGAPYQFGLSGLVVPYYRCAMCSFIFTDFLDDWSDDEVAQFIYNADYVKVDPEYSGGRATKTATEMKTRLAGCEGARILDYGSGSGKFAEEMMR